MPQRIDYTKIVPGALRNWRILRLRWSPSTRGPASLSVFARSLGRINRHRIDSLVTMSRH
jgi:hypothetical protein